MRELTYAQAINEALDDALASDPRVFLMGEDIAAYGGVFAVTKGLYEKYGAERVVDTPISESGFIGAGVGAAINGMKPIVEVMWVDFAMVAMDQIVNQLAKVSYMSGGAVKAPLIIRTQQGAGRGNGAQHSQSLESMFAQVPGLLVLAPSDPADAKGLLTAAIAEEKPVIFLEHKLLYPNKGPVPEGRHVVPVGRAAVRREGRDVTIVSLSRMVSYALEAAARLESESISAEVIDLRSLVPLDLETVGRSLRKTGRVVIVHEAHRSFGWGAEISARLMEEHFFDLTAPVSRVCSRDVPFPYNRKLEAFVMPCVADIVEVARRLHNDY